MNVGIKFCGGCNPLYERKNIVKRLLADYEGIVCQAIAEGSQYDLDLDLVLVICGCKASCSQYDNLKKFKDVIFIYSEEDYCQIIEFMKKRNT